MHAKLLAGLLCVFAVSITAHAAPPAPCSILSPAQVSYALGAKFADGEPIGTKSCSWTAQSANAEGKKVTVTVTVMDSNAYDQGMMFSGKGVTHTPVTGLGDQAAYVIFGDRFSTLGVKKGSNAFNVKIYGLPLDQAKDKEKNLASEAVSKL